VQCVVNRNDYERCLRPTMRGRHDARGTTGRTEFGAEKSLKQLSRARCLPARIVERARMVLRAGLRPAGQGDRITPEKAARWRNRFLAEGIAPLCLVERTIHQKPARATRWSTRTMAVAAAISESSVRHLAPQWPRAASDPELRRRA
jgi:hypothetical protein